MGIIGNIMFHMSRSIAIICMNIVDHLLPVVRIPHRTHAVAKRVVQGVAGASGDAHRSAPQRSTGSLPPTPEANSRTRRRPPASDANGGVAPPEP